MTITTFSVASAVTPTVLKTGVAHYAFRKPRAKKPTAHISYDEGLHLIKCFLTYASHKTVDDIQAFTAQWVPTPTWVKTENVDIPAEYVSKAADAIIEQLGPDGIKAVGGTEWWQWRRNDSVLRAEWVEMNSNYLERKRENKKCRRIMLYVHGGGYFFGSVDEHRYQLQRHARKLKARVIAPRYRLAPQFPFPCSLQDCLAVYLYLLTIHAPNEIIFAGDSAGGGLVVSMLCILRDRNLPLPAGAVLISPWVDLTHSFPSVAEENPLDYIPPHGFHHRPSVAWPPPNDDETKLIEHLSQTKSREEGFTAKTTGLAEKLGETTRDNNDPGSSTANRVPASDHFLSIEINNKLVVLKEQIQMYTTNQLLAHPLVSPVLQPSLGGLPPLLILVGGGEMLRDEQIYLAHKAANPHKYPLSDTYRGRYDPDDKILNRYKPTPVQLQVWEDLCHVAPTLSFTRPAKYMYRSISQFGAWALARAQERPIEIMDDDNISIISTESNSESPSESSDSIARMKAANEPQPKFVGRAGDPLPFFHNHMIRQLVDRYGNISDLASADELPATTMNINEIGLIKQGPVQKWMTAKETWASKYASTKKKVQKQRIDAIRSKKNVPFGPDERPPPSALAARRTAREVSKKQRRSYGLAMWSMWGSKHDEATIKREEEMATDATQLEAPESDQHQLDGAIKDTTDPPARESATSPRPRRSSRRSMSRGSKSRNQLSAAEDPSSRSRSRRRTISVTDRGQANADFSPTRSNQPPLPAFPESSLQAEHENVVITPPATATESDRPNLSPAVSPLQPYSTAPESTAQPLFLPKFRTASHLRSPSQSQDVDTMSTRTGYSALSVSGASTRAVFSAPGVTKGMNGSIDPSASFYGEATASSAVPAEHTPTSPPNASNPKTSSSPSSSATPTPTAPTFPPTDHRSLMNGTDGGTDTPTSRRSIDRLRTHQLEYEVEMREAEIQRLSVAHGAEIEGGGKLMNSVEEGKGKAVADDGDEEEGGKVSNGTNGVQLLPPLHPLRSPSSVAIVGVEGVVGVVENGRGEGAR